MDMYDKEEVNRFEIGSGVSFVLESCLMNRLDYFYQFQILNLFLLAAEKEQEKKNIFYKEMFKFEIHMFLLLQLEEWMENPSLDCVSEMYLKVLIYFLRGYIQRLDNVYLQRLYNTIFDLLEIKGIRFYLFLLLDILLKHNCVFSIDLQSRNYFSGLIAMITSSFWLDNIIYNRTKNEQQIITHFGKIAYLSLPNKARNYYHISILKQLLYYVNGSPINTITFPYKEFLYLSLQHTNVTVRLYALNILFQLTDERIVEDMFFQVKVYPIHILLRLLENVEIVEELALLLIIFEWLLLFLHFLDTLEQETPLRCEYYQKILSSFHTQKSTLMFTQDFGYYELSQIQQLVYLILHFACHKIDIACSYKNSSSLLQSLFIIGLEKFPNTTLNAFYNTNAKHYIRKNRYNFPILMQVRPLFADTLQDLCYNVLSEWDDFDFLCFCSN